MGAVLLVAAIMVWLTSIMMDPRGDSVAQGTDYFRPTVLTFMRHSAIGTLVLCALSAWLLFPARRPKWPARDWALIVVLVLLAGSSIYTLVWQYVSVFH